MVPVTAIWNANTESDLAGYRLYWGWRSGIYDGPGAPFDAGNLTTVKGVITPGRWHFAVTAYNTSAQESPKSEEVTEDIGVKLRHRR